MAPGQIPHLPAPWRGTYPFFLLSPLMGLLNRAWSLLRGPGPPEPWLVEAVTGADQGGAGLEGEAKASLATYHAPWGRHPQEETKDSGAAEEDGETSLEACRDLEAKHSLPEVWGLSNDDDEKYGGEEATGVPREQEEFMDGQPAPLSLSLLIRSLPDLPGEEESKEEVVTGGTVTAFSFPLSHWECCSGEEEEEEEDGEAVRVCGPVNGATEERTETEAATKTSMSPSSVGPHLRAWECCSGEEPEEEEDNQAEKGDADPGPHATSLAQRPSLRTWQHPSSAITEVEEEDCDSEETGASFPIPPTSAFLSAWVYRPGEDTEEEDEEEGDCDSEAAEDEGEAEVSSSIPPISAFLSAWVYRPGEDTEEEEDEYEDEDDESGAADLGPSPSLQTQSALLRGQIYQPGEKRDGGEAAEKWGEAEPCPFRVAIYLPGEKPPPPWAPPQLPLRLQRRFKSAQAPTRHPDLEPLPKTRKVRFSEKVSVHPLVVWAGPAQAARRGPWEQFARDRSRFARRIAQVQEELGPYLTPAARARAWARLGNPPTSLATAPAPTRTSPMSPIQATPLNQALASPSPPCVSPSLDLSGRRG
ncbi:protein phosphatase 1 regulatory subunit 15A [Moschus berezovskii]|uniref:protein phosphatase 1 regulatory subunit 15A n=1 Tax=Moschus berezovskii TaxID=68408 RepID=UPI002443CF28|nr:protein phosphatase 1 regulatory subunit 15A [Moschus berezovskii]